MSRPRNSKENISNENMTLEERMEALEGELDDMNMTASVQSKDITTLRARVEQLNDDIGEISEGASAEDLARVEGAIAALEAKVNEAAASLQERASDIEVVRREIETVGTSGRELGDKLETLQGSVAERIEAVKGDLEQCASFVKKEEFDEINLNTLEKIEEIEQRADTNQQSLRQQVDSVYETLRGEMDSLRTECAELQKGATEESLEELRQTVQSLKDSLEGSGELSEKAKAALETVHKLEELSAEFESRLTDQLKNIEEQMARLDPRFSAVTEKAEEAEAQVLSQMETVRMALRLVEQLDDKSKSVNFSAGAAPIAPSQPIVVQAAPAAGPVDMAPTGIIVTDADVAIPATSEDLGYELSDVLGVVVQNNASDLHIKVGVPPMVRLHGELVPVGQAALTSDDAKALVFSAMSKSQRKQLLCGREVDFAYACDGARYRVNAFMERGNVSAAFRMLRSDIATLDTLGLPEVLKKLAMSNNGIILVTGPAGSGKSTTLAAMLDYINENRKCHVVTIEDPIEFFHKDKMSIITQREVGLDTPSFVEALRMSLRQDPNVIMVGEMRDAETMMTAVTAAETGHLVLSTLHTPNAVQAVDRIIDTFSGDIQRQFRLLLSSSLRGVVSQKLLLRADGNGRVAAAEIMVNTPTISSLILEGKTNEIYPFIQQGSNDGMQTFTQSMLQLYNDGLITKEEGFSHADQPTEFRMGMEGHVASNTAAQNEIADETLMNWL
ncbi:MAG: PilT/PilU family type 4a pilus ATPase [bacterium]|nr:PilT/PilU family type 4a pilus ATPase [bacterium]